MDLDVPMFPLVLDCLALEDVRHLLTYVHLGESAEVSIRVPRELCEGHEPAFKRGCGFGRGFLGSIPSGFDSTTVGMSNYDNMLDLDLHDSVVENRDGVVISDEELAVRRR